MEEDVATPGLRGDALILVLGTYSQYAVKACEEINPCARFLVLQGKGDLVRGYGTLTQDHPRVSATAEVNDGSRDRARRGAAIDDQGNFLTELLAHAGRKGAFRKSAKVCRRRSDRETELADNRAADGSLRNAQRYVAGVRSHAQRELASSFDDDCQRSWPELLGQFVKVIVNGACELVRLGHICNEEGKRLVASTRFEIVDPFHRAKVDRVDGESIESVGGKGHHIAALKRLDDLRDKVRLWFVWMNAKNFCVQR
jgi:hypothetical protein